MDVRRWLVSVARFSALVVSAAATWNPCPPRVLLDPCVCIPNSANVQCTDFDSASDLEEVMARSSDHPVTGLYLKGASMPYLPSSVLLSKQTAEVVVWDSVLVSLFDRAPDPGNAVTHLRLRRTRLMRGLQWDLLRTMGNLAHVSLHSVEVRKLGRSFRDHVSGNLFSFVMVATKTRRIQDDAFRNMSLLAWIQIQNTRVSDLRRSMFAYPSQIYFFDFSDNRIESLPADMFEDIPKLQVVLLKGNRISLLSEGTFGKLFDRGISGVHLSGNPLECTCSMRWFLTAKSRLPIFGNCSAPIDMVGKRLINLTADDFNYCPGN